jgi:hypothetical protein
MHAAGGFVHPVNKEPDNSILIEDSSGEELYEALFFLLVFPTPSADAGSGLESLLPVPKD